MNVSSQILGDSQALQPGSRGLFAQSTLPPRRALGLGKGGRRLEAAGEVAEKLRGKVTRYLRC